MQPNGGGSRNQRCNQNQAGEEPLVAIVQLAMAG